MTEQQKKRKDTIQKDNNLKQEMAKDVAVNLSCPVFFTEKSSIDQALWSHEELVVSEMHKFNRTVPTSHLHTNYSLGMQDVLIWEAKKMPMRPEKREWEVLRPSEMCLIHTLSSANLPRTQLSSRGENNKDLDTATYQNKAFYLMCWWKQKSEVINGHTQEEETRPLQHVVNTPKQ